MLEIGFIDTATWVFMIVAGLIGFLYSSERVIAALPWIGGKVDTEDSQTKFFKVLSAIMGIATTAWVLLLWIDEIAEFHWITVVLLMLYTLIVLAEPTKNLEGWKVFILLIPLVLVTIVAAWFAAGREFEVFGFVIPLWVPLAVITVIMLIVFIIIYWLEETAIDPLLTFLGWAPFVVIISALLIIQGILLIFYHPDGIAEFAGALIGKYRS